MMVDLLITHGTLLTMTDVMELRDGAIAIESGRIVAVGPTDELSTAYPDAPRLDARGGVVHPGFVDAHVHLTHHLGRSTIPDEWPEEDEPRQVFPYMAAMGPEEAYISSAVACLEMLKNGTTTFSDMSGMFQGELRLRAATEVGLRGAVSELCWDVPPKPDLAMGTTDDCLAGLQNLLERIPATDDARVWGAVNLSGMGKASDALLVGAMRLARDRGLTMAIHQSFAPADVAAYRAQTGTSAVEHLSDLGLLGPELTLVHFNYCEDRELELLAQSGTNVVHCPGASVRSGIGASRVGRFPDLLEAGVNVALGSDSGNYADAFDITRQAFLAATIHREARGGRPVISSTQALRMATHHGAAALGLGAQLGRIEVGLQADLVVHDPDHVLWQPFLNITNLLVYSAQSRTVDTVLVGGEIVLREGRSTRVDEAALVTQAREAAQRMYQEMGWSPGPSGWIPTADASEPPPA